MKLREKIANVVMPQGRITASELQSILFDAAYGEHPVIKGLLATGDVKKEDLLLIDNLDEKIEKLLFINKITAEFLEHATDEDFKAMFSNVPKINLDIFKQ